MSGGVEMCSGSPPELKPNLNAAQIGGGSSSSGNKDKKKHGNSNNRRFRRNYYQQRGGGGGEGGHHRRNNHHYYHAKRIRRNTQPAPKNTNEFLMQEHDHLYHLDFENFPEGGGGGGDHDNMELGRHPSFGTSGTYSSSEEDQDYLSREFSATYDTVNAERLSSMSKGELIAEYQALQERVESLEQRLKSVVKTPNMQTFSLGNFDFSGGSSSPPSPPPEEDEEDEPVITAANADDEVRRLREENKKIKAHNRHLQKRLNYRGQPLDLNLLLGAAATRNELARDLEPDQKSTDSGVGPQGVDEQMA